MKAMTRNFGTTVPATRETRRQLPAVSVPQISVNQQLWRGGVAGAAAAILGLLLAQSLSSGAVVNIAAATVANGGLVLIAAALSARVRLVSLASLAVLGGAVFAAGIAGLGHPAWLMAASFTSAAGGVLAQRVTPFGSLFAGWAVFHGLIAVALLVMVG